MILPKNFMSVGNVTQAVRFTDNGPSMVLATIQTLEETVAETALVRQLLSMQPAMLSMEMHLQTYAKIIQ